MKHIDGDLMGWNWLDNIWVKRCAGYLAACTFGAMMVMIYPPLASDLIGYSALLFIAFLYCLPAFLSLNLAYFLAAYYRPRLCRFRLLMNMMIGAICGLSPYVAMAGKAVIDNAQSMSLSLWLLGSGALTGTLFHYIENSGWLVRILDKAFAGREG